MQITIDTSKDSPEEIRRAIRMLAEITKHHPDADEESPQLSDEPKEQEGTNDAFAAMFGSQGQQQLPQENAPEDKEEKSKGTPEVQIVDY